MYGIYINFGCRFEFRMQKIPYERISGNFSDFTNFGHFWILAVFKIYGIYINLGCRFEFRMRKLPYERISGNFSDFTDFGHQVRVCKKDLISILAVIQKIWDLHKFGLQNWIQNAKITLWKNFGQFFRFHRFWSSGPCMQKKASFQY